MKAWGYLLSAALLAGAFFAGRWTKPCGALETVRRDTVILRDTLTVPVPTPASSEVIGTDTCLLRLAVPFARPAEAAHTLDAADPVGWGVAAHTPGMVAPVGWGVAVHTSGTVAPVDWSVASHAPGEPSPNSEQHAAPEDAAGVLRTVPNAPATGSAPEDNAGRPDAADGIRNESPVLTRCAASLLRAVDSLRVPVVVPIERRVYVTADYRAEVEGYRPRLVNIELYRQTQVVTETPAARPCRWGIGIQAGYGLAPRTGRWEPYIGIGIQYSLWQW